MTAEEWFSGSNVPVSFLNYYKHCILYTLTSPHLGCLKPWFSLATQHKRKHTSAYFTVKMALRKLKDNFFPFLVLASHSFSHDVKLLCFCLCLQRPVLTSLVKTRFNREEEFGEEY